MSATIKDISQHTGLSIATISKYINGGNVREGNRRVIEEAIAALDYSVNEAARSLKTRQSGYIGLLVPALNSPFMTDLVHFTQETIHQKGWGVSLYCLSSAPSEERKKEEHEAIRFMLRKGIDGLINLPMNEDGSHLADVIAADIPVTLIDKHIAGLAGQVNSVVIDNVGACRQLTDELLNAGHRKVVAIFGDRDNYTASRRYEGFLDACRQRGLNPDPQFILYQSDFPSGSEEMMEQVLSLLDRGATAILTTTEKEMRIVLRELRHRHIHVPEDISFASFDGGADSPYSDITSIIQPKQGISTLAAEITCEQVMAQRKDVHLPPQLRTLSATLYQGRSIRMA